MRMTAGRTSISPNRKTGRRSNFRPLPFCRNEQTGQFNKRKVLFNLRPGKYSAGFSYLYFFHSSLKIPTAIYIRYPRNRTPIGRITRNSTVFQTILQTAASTIAPMTFPPLSGCSYDNKTALPCQTPKTVLQEELCATNVPAAASIPFRRSRPELTTSAPYAFGKIPFIITAPRTKYVAAIM